MNKLICFIIESLLAAILTIGVGALLVTFIFAISGSGNVVMALILSVFVVVGLILITITVLAESWEGVREAKKI